MKELPGAPALPDGWFYRVESDPDRDPDWYLVSIYLTKMRWWGQQNRLVSKADAKVREDNLAHGAELAWAAAQKRNRRNVIVGDYR